MAENTNNTVKKFVTGFIFCNSFSNILLVKYEQDNIWKGISGTIPAEENNFQDVLTTRVKELTNQEIKQESWKDVCQIVNVEKTWESYYFMTVFTELDKMIVKKENVQTRIFPVYTLTSEICSVPSLWKILMSLDANLCGMLSRVVYYQ